MTWGPLTRAWLLAAAILCVFAVTSRADAAPTRVGLVVNLRVNIEEQRANELAAALGRALRKKEGVDVVAGAEVARRLEPEGVPEDCVADPACVERVADRLDADELLFLVLVKIGDTVQIDSTWASRGGTRTLSRDQVVLENSPDDKVFAQAASGLLPPGRRTSAIEPTAPPPAPSKPRNKVVVAQDGPTTYGVLPIAIAGGAAILALAGGIGMAVTTRDDYEAALDFGCDVRVCGGKQEAALDDLSRRGVVTQVLFATAAVAGTTALLLYLANEESRPATKTARLASVDVPRVGIIAMGDTLGVSVGGSL